MIDPEELILDLIDQWHTAKDATVSLPAFLGMSNDQYARWVMSKMPADELAEWAVARSQSAEGTST